MPDAYARRSMYYQKVQWGSAGRALLGSVPVFIALLRLLLFTCETCGPTLTILTMLYQANQHVWMSWSACTHRPLDRRCSFR